MQTGRGEPHAEQRPFFLLKISPQLKQVTFCCSCIVSDENDSSLSSNLLFLYVR